VLQNLYALSAGLEEKLDPIEQQRFTRLQARLEEMMQMITTWHRAITVDMSSVAADFSPVKIRDVVTQAVETVEPHARRKAIEIAVSLPDRPMWTCGNAPILVEALVNLMNNAVKYTPMGGHTWIEAGEEDDSIWIEVSDDGIGIAAEDLPHIFEDFYRGTHKPDNVSGSGVGLALTRRIIEAHGGSIAVESTPGEGSRFKLRLPSQALEHPGFAAAVPATAMKKGDPDGLTKENIDHR
jgi:signal transduction histidine kinase